MMHSCPLLVPVNQRSAQKAKQERNINVISVYILTNIQLMLQFLRFFQSLQKFSEHRSPPNVRVRIRG